MVAFDKMFPQFLKEDYAGLRQTFCQARPQRNTVPLVLERLLSDEEHSLIVFGGDKEVDHTVVIAIIVCGDAEYVQNADRVGA